jgi:hypothetical protein
VIRPKGCTTYSLPPARVKPNKSKLAQNVECFGSSTGTKLEEMERERTVVDAPPHGGKQATEQLTGGAECPFVNHISTVRVNG